MATMLIEMGPARRRSFLVVQGAEKLVHAFRRLLETNAPTVRVTNL
jgi:hypothetical protein